jgi:hypothetical protein
MFRTAHPMLALTCLSLCLSAAWAQPAPATAAQLALQEAQGNVMAAGKNAKELEAQLKQAEEAAFTADQVVATLDLRGADAQRLEQFSRQHAAAREARKQLQLTKKAKADADATLAKASKFQDEAAENYLCEARPALCPRDPGPVLTASQFNAIALLGAQAKLAETRIEEHGLAAKVPDTVKQAAAAEVRVRDWVAQRNEKGTTEPVDATLVKHSREATTKAKTAAEDFKTLGTGIERVNAASVAWAGCQEGRPCAGFSADELGKLETQANGLYKEADQIHAGVKLARTEAYWLDERVTTAKASAQPSLVDLLGLIDEVPDAKSLFGASDAVRVSASASGAEAAIRLDLNRLPNTLTRDTRVIFTAPKGKDGRGRLLGFTDADDVLPSVQLVRDLRRGKQSFGSWGEALYVFGVNGKLSYSEHAYRDRAQLGIEKTERNTPLSLGVQLGVAGIDAKKFHLLRANYAEFYKNASVETVCPATPAAGQTWLTCVDASFAEPERQRGWVFGYETRWTWKNAAVAFGFEYDRRTNRKTYSLPVYLLRDTEAKDKPFTGGISLDYKTRSTLEPKRSFEFGVFVGAPFSLFTR